MKKKDFKMVKRKFEFKPDRLNIISEEGDKISTESMLYKTIKCLNMMGQGAFYFRNANKVFFLYFKNYVPEDAAKWHALLKNNLEKHSENKNDIKKVDIGENFGLLHWEDKTIDYHFSYKTETLNKKDLSNGFNDDVVEIWISDDEIVQK